LVLERCQQLWALLRRKLQKIEPEIRRIRDSIPPNAPRSLALGGVFLSFGFRRRFLGAGFAALYLFLSSPSATSFERSFKDWFHVVFFPSIVEALHALWRRKLEGKGNAGSGFTNFVRNLSSPKETKGPTVTEIYETVRQYESVITDYGMFKVATKSEGDFHVTFVGALNRWFLWSKTEPLEDSERVLNQLLLVDRQPRRVA